MHEQLQRGREIAISALRLAEHTAEATRLQQCEVVSVPQASIEGFACRVLPSRNRVEVAEELLASISLTTAELIAAAARLSTPTLVLNEEVSIYDIYLIWKGHFLLTFDVCLNAIGSILDEEVAAKEGKELLDDFPSLFDRFRELLRDRERVADDGSVFSISVNGPEVAGLLPKVRGLIAYPHTQRDGELITAAILGLEAASTEPGTTHVVTLPALKRPVLH